MGQIKVILPAMGEGIFEATITQWLVKEGDVVEEDDSIVEIATDKVDSEVPAPGTGKILKLLVPENEIAKVGQAIAIIETEGGTNEGTTYKNSSSKAKAATEASSDKTIDKVIKDPKAEVASSENYIYPGIPHRLPSGAFLSPLVRSIAGEESISIEELENLSSLVTNRRLTKDDLVQYLSNRTPQEEMGTTTENEGVEVIKMGRMRKLIAEHMVKSVQVSPHVTSFHEVDVTSLVNWRLKHKDHFLKAHGEKLTFTPIFIEAVIAAIKELPLINVSVEDDNILLKKNINIGMATALTDGNLIVPVIKNADRLSLSGLAHKVNDFANRARQKNLQPDEITGGTFTITNVGSFGNLTGTPIINQPQVAIIAIGTITKRPAVIETPQGDTIGIRQMMILSLSYDHRVVDGALGGMFLKKVADILEAFDETRVV